MSDLGSTRVFGNEGGQGVVTVGLRRRPLADLYHRLVTGSWARLLLVYGAVYLATETLFGVAHFYLDPAIPPRGSLVGALLALLPGAPARPDPALSARAIAAALLSGTEEFLRWLEVAIASGIVLAKFSLLKARVLFSEVAVVAPHDGATALMFRMANERTSHIVDARVQVMLVRNEPSEDGEVVRRAHDLPLTRGGSALFAHAWTAVHPVDRTSPLAGESAASLEDAKAELLVTLSGYDEGLTRTIHARHVYPAGRIRWDARFRDIVKLLADGRRVVDYRRFHDVVAAEERRPERTPARRAR